MPDSLRFQTFNLLLVEPSQRQKTKLILHSLMAHVTSDGKVVTAKRDGTTYISCTTLVRETLELHRGNTASILQFESNPTIMFLQLYAVVWGKQVHSLHRHGYVRCNVQNEENVLDAVRANPLTSARCSGPPLSAVWHTLHAGQVYSFHVQLAQGLQPGDNNLRLQFSRWLLHKPVAEPAFCAGYCGLMRKHSQGVK